MRQHHRGQFMHQHRRQGRRDAAAVEAEVLVEQVMLPAHMENWDTLGQTLP